MNKTFKLRIDLLALGGTILLFLIRICGGFIIMSALIFVAMSIVVLYPVNVVSSKIGAYLGGIINRIVSIIIEIGTGIEHKTAELMHLINDKHTNIINNENKYE